MPRPQPSEPAEPVAGALPQPAPIRLGLPKGRMQGGVLKLLEDARIEVTLGRREYRPSISLPGFEVKLLKPQNIVEMLHAGSRDIGFAGADWVAEHDLPLVELLDTALDPVQIVAAAPRELLVDGRLPARPLVVASEYERLTRRWIEREALDARFVHSYGATEVFPPEDADCIVDNSATGSTLAANNLQVVHELMRSSTRLYANPRTLEDPPRREAVDQFVLLLRSVLEARSRIMLEINVPEARLDAIVAVLPCMREPTISRLHGESGYAVKAAVPRAELPRLIPELKRRGGSDLVVSSPVADRPLASDARPAHLAGRRPGGPPSLRPSRATRVPWTSSSTGTKGSPPRARSSTRPSRAVRSSCAATPMPAPSRHAWPSATASRPSRSS